ncbi:MAG: prephenate dehydrogenase/arogenate dehydrogenase family protein [Deltaproteobacteria bacterium]|nr:prephenate dehydrogenase/arogenate dehydrogenase family protein [Deltaproteobacteria bacterium]
MSVLFERMAIVGVGLIGGSLAKAVKEKKLVGEVLGVGRSEERLESARKLGIIDRYSGRMNDILGEADLVVVAGPVGVIVDLIREMIPFLKKGTIITDVGSVKKKIVKEVEAFIPGSLYFVGGHPIAGTENSGFEASFSTLFEGRKCIITPVSTTDSHALERVKELWTQVGSVVACMDSEEHDEVFAAVSHLPHIVAYSMVNSLLKAKGFEKNIFSFSAGGFKDFTRIAASDPVMWKDIALMNKDKLLSAIKLFQEYLEELKEAIEREDGERLLSEFQKSREFKRLMD